MRAAHRAVLQQELVILTALPERSGFWGRAGKKFVDMAVHQSRPLPKITVVWLDMIPP